MDEDGEQLGILNTRDALDRAKDKGLDLVEVSPNADPPVCKIMDYGKFKYQQQKKLQEAKKKQTVIKIKEVKFRPKTDEHDYQTKLSLGMRQIKALTTDDPLRKDLLKSVADIGANQFSAAEFFISAVVAGQHSNSWSPQAQDLHKRSKASMTMATELLKASIPALRELYERSSFFKETMSSSHLFGCFSFWH